jgi:ATP-binding cassette subfamily B protein
VAILAIMASLNRSLALVAFLAVPVYALVSWRMSRRLETQLEEYYGLWDGVSGRIQETMSGIKTVLAHGAAEHEYRRLDAATGEAFRSYLERNRMQNRYSLLQESVVAAAKGCTLLLGGLKALEHQLTPGDVVLFVAYLDQLYNPIQSLTDLYASLQEKMSSVNRAHRLLDTPADPGEELPEFRPGPGEIEFREVRFGYVPERTILDGVSFRVPAGQHVAIIGPSGAGKTTLTDLLVGLYRPQSGEILVDGQSVSAVSPSSLRAAVRGVAPDGTLFRASIADNIRYGWQAATAAEVEEAARLAGLEPVLARLPGGLETEVGERGFELSAGERQRVLLARAFVARPSVLVLDEATANLDFRTEAAIKEAVARIAEGRTTLLIAHRRSMLTAVDRVLVLRGGRIEQDGPPGELVRQPGYFRDMMQAATPAGDVQEAVARRDAGPDEGTA